MKNPWFQRILWFLKSALGKGSRNTLTGKGAKNTQKIGALGGFARENHYFTKKITNVNRPASIFTTCSYTIP